MAELANVLDWINLMTYDLHGSWQSVTGQHTALVNNNDPSDKLTVTYSVDNWINKGKTNFVDASNDQRTHQLISLDQKVEPL